MKLKKNAKRVTSLFLALVMVVSLFAGFEFTTEAADYVQSSDEFADANGDGIINRLDPIRTRKNVAGSVTSNNQSDINGDGSVDTLDIVLSKKMAAGELDEASFYSRKISGDTYKFIFGRKANGSDGNINELTWDAEENAYHYHIDGTAKNGYSDRMIWFDAAFINKVIEYTGATSMSFKVKAGIDSPWASLYGYCTSEGAFSSYNSIQLSSTYQTLEFVFSELPLDDNYNMKMPFLLYQHADGVSGDLYISDITFNVPEEEVEGTWNASSGVWNFTTEKFGLTSTTPVMSGVSSGYVNPQENHVYLDWTANYGAKFTFNTALQNVTDDTKLRLYVSASSVGDSTDTVSEFGLYHIDCTTNLDVAAGVKASVTDGGGATIEVDLSKLVDEDGTFRGFQFVNLNTDTRTVYRVYWMQIGTVTPTVEWEAYSDTVVFNTTNFSVSDPAVSGVNNLMTVNTAAVTDVFYCTPSSTNSYNGKSFTLNEPITNVTSDMKLKLKVYTTYDANKTYDETATFHLYNLAYTGDANDASSYVTQSITKRTATAEYEFDLANFVDSDGVFRGFQLINFGDYNTIYYLYSIQIWRETPDEVWEVHDARDFNTTDFTATSVHTVSGLHQSNMTVGAVDDMMTCSTTNANLYYGAKFALNRPIANVTDDMKLRMMVYVTGDSTTNTNFYLYHVDYSGNANYNCVKVQDIQHAAWTVIEVDITQFLDSDGTFRGFQIGNIDSATTAYYFRWLDIVKVQEEFDPVGYSLDFIEPNVTVSAMDMDDINNKYEGTFTTEDSNSILSFANSTAYTFGGKKVTFEQSIENCTEDMLVTFRMKVTKPENANTTVDSESATIRLHVADAYGLNSNNSYTDIVVPVGEWTDVTCSLENLLVDGRFDGFYWSNFTNNYTVIFDSLTIEQSDAILTNGVSTYRLLVPADSSDLITTAAEEFNTFFGEATGTELAVVSDDAVVEGQKYISLGETSLLAETDITYNTSELGSDGFKIVTEGDNIYAVGGSDYGTLYATYELLAKLVNYEYFYKDTYTLNENVKDIALQDFNISEVPDIATRTASDGVVSSDAMSMHRMRVRQYNEDMLWVGNQWVHTSFNFVNGVASDGTTNTTSDKWFNDGKTQLCYTAHGDATEYAAMLDACLNTLKGRIKAQPDKRNVIFGSQDNNDTCTCDSCAALKTTYGADSAAVVLFVQDLQDKLEAWFATTEGQTYAGEFNIIVLAYKEYVDAPSNLTVDGSINCLLALSAADYYQPISADNTTNATYYNAMTAWGDITDSLYTWYYSTNFSHYLAPYDSISNMQENYQLAVSNGAKYLYDQRQHNETGFVTGWSNLKSYLGSKLAWDVDADVSALTTQFFDAYFGSAATDMKTYYDELVERTEYNLATYDEFGGPRSATYGTVSITEELCVADYWPQATLETWLGYCDAALTDIASLESSDPELYEKYKDHIEGERLAILYLYIESHLDYSNAVAMYPYMQEVQNIVNDLGVTRVSEASSISTLLDKWGVSATDPAVVWTHGADDTSVTGVNGSGTVSYNDGVWKLANCYMYSAHKLAFVEPQTCDGSETVTISITATANTSGMDDLKLILLPYNATSLPTYPEIDNALWGYDGTLVTVQNGAISFDVDEFLVDGKFIGFTLVTYGYDTYETGQMYTIELGDITVE